MADVVLKHRYSTIVKLEILWANRAEYLIECLVRKMGVKWFEKSLGRTYFRAIILPKKHCRDAAHRCCMQISIILQGPGLDPRRRHSYDTGWRETDETTEGPGDPTLATLSLIGRSPDRCPEAISLDPSP